MLEVYSRTDLLGTGMTPRGITTAVRTGALIRARNGFYLPATAPIPLVEAVRVGGRLGCLSLLAILGVFVFDATVLHVHMERGDSRMRAAGPVSAPLPARAKRVNVVLHWHPLIGIATRGCVGVVDAVVHAVRCQEPKHAIATLDSVLCQGLLTERELDDVFAALPPRFRAIRAFLDGLAESGTESLVRLMLVRLGCTVELQVRFDGVGRVDLLVDGWLVVECDSEAFHGSWEQQLADYRRDLALAALGYPVLRLAAADILYRPEAVLASLRGLLSRGRATA